MGVNVTIGRRGTGSDHIETHERGDSINVNNGHLHVVAGADTLAIYAPEKWLSAVVE